MADATKSKEVVITRVFAAPVEKVWKAFTDPEALKKWWGPKDFTAPMAKMDVRVGGSYVWAMQSPDGQVMYSGGTFKEVVTNQRLVYADSFTDEHGNKLSPAAVGMGDDFPAEMQVSVTFEKMATPPEGGALTRLTIHHSPAPDGDMADMMEAGWHQSLDKLATSVQ